MRPRNTASRLKLALVVLGFGGLVALSLPAVGLSPLNALSSEAKPGPTSNELRPVGGRGALPERAPQLRATDAPLSVAERGYAIHLAQESMPAGATDVLGNPGGEVLVADLPPIEDRTTGRRATVAIYDYTTDRLHQALVDLAAGSVVRSREVRGLQLPPSIAETTIAIQLALAAEPAPAFVAEYRRVIGAPLVAAEQVHTVAGVWRPVDETTKDAAGNGPTKTCGAHRCLQLLIALPSGQYLGTQDFAVDLSSRTVLPVTPVDQEHHHGD